MRDRVGVAIVVAIAAAAAVVVVVVVMVILRQEAEKKCRPRCSGSPGLGRAARAAKSGDDDKDR